MEVFMRRRVVITGLGCITPVGNDVDTVWENIIAGISGVDYITVPVGRTNAGRVGGRVDVTNRGGISVAACGTRLTQADRINPASRRHGRNFFMN